MLLAGNLNFKLRIVFWNIFFWRFEKRIALSEKKPPLAQLSGPKNCANKAPKPYIDYYTIYMMFCLLKMNMELLGCRHKKSNHIMLVTYVGGLKRHQMYNYYKWDLSNHMFTVIFFTVCTFTLSI